MQTLSSELKGGVNVTGIDARYVTEEDQASQEDEINRVKPMNSALS